MEAYQETFNIWRSRLCGTEYEEELQRLSGDPQAVKEAFYRWVEFGTAGMRGELGLGTNRLNVFTVRRATQGLANYILASGRAADGVVIAYDSRHGSALFAKETALTLAANGVRALLYPCYTSVPQLSFSILELGCAAGVVITASHNPAKYNGYKLYGADGGQVANEVAAAILQEVDAINDCFSVPIMDEETALAQGLLVYIGKELDDLYIQRVKELCPDPQAVREQGAKLKVVYTPLNGTGMRALPRILHELGLQHLYIVPEQEQPDGSFPTVSAPNPEAPDAWDLAIRLADRVGADLMLATDPDCDRLGLAVRDKDGCFRMLTGNQIGCLLLDYVLAHTPAQAGDFAVTSIVSTPMSGAVAAAHGVEMRWVLTGFKYIAEQIRLSREQQQGRFRFGFEESFGYLTGDYCRDKDAALAAMLAVSAACSLAGEGKGLLDDLDRLYRQHGYHAEKVLSFTREGAAGLQAIKSAVAALRQDPPQSFAGQPVLSVSDYLNREKRLADGKISCIDLPKADIVSLTLPRATVIFRPSGTEPKLKAYVSVSADSQEDAAASLEELVRTAKATVEGLL